MAQTAFDLTGKVALVTGGNGGIGLGMAEGLAAAGADLVIWGGNQTKLATAEATLRAFGRRVLVQRCDVADEQAVEGPKAALSPGWATLPQRSSRSSSRRHRRERSVAVGLLRRVR